MKDAHTLIENLCHTDVDIVIESKKELLSLGGSVVPYLVSALASRDVKRLIAVVRLLGCLRKEAATATKALITICYVNNPELRANVIAALGMIAENAEECLPVLKRYLKDEDINVRRHAVAALGEFGGTTKKAIHELISALRDNDSVVREFAASILYEIGHVPFHLLPKIFVARKDSNPYVTISINKLLEKIAKENGLSLSDMIKFGYVTTSDSESRDAAQHFPLKAVVG